MALREPLPGTYLEHIPPLPIVETMRGVESHNRPPGAVLVGASLPPSTVQIGRGELPVEPYGLSGHIAVDLLTICQQWHAPEAAPVALFCRAQWMSPSPQA